MTSVAAYLRDLAVDDLFPWSAQLAAADRFGVPVSVVEELALAVGLLPTRYQRNRQTITASQQLTLFRSRVAVVGCGGLGGYVIEELGRLGVGTIVAIDPDRFEEHNLNRQLLSTPATLGQAKVAAAAERLATINPAVDLVPLQAAYTPAAGARQPVGDLSAHPVLPKALSLLLFQGLYRQGFDGHQGLPGVGAAGA